MRRALLIHIAISDENQKTLVLFQIKKNFAILHTTDSNFKEYWIH